MLLGTKGLIKTSKAVHKRRLSHRRVNSKSSRRKSSSRRRTTIPPRCAKGGNEISKPHMLSMLKLQAYHVGVDLKSIGLIPYYIVVNIAVGS